MTAIRLVLRTPWLWVVVGLILALSPRVVAVVFFALACAAFMLAFAYFFRREWVRTGKITLRIRLPKRTFIVRRRWCALTTVGTFGALGVFALMIAVEALIVGVPTK